MSLNWLKTEFKEHIGQINHFNWATTRQQALEALQYFIDYQLIHFGQYQDAMVTGKITLSQSAFSLSKLWSLKFVMLLNQLITMFQIPLERC
jgi:deoxyribodipyrimidine photolyase-like uncharacterized protein